MTDFCIDNFYVHHKTDPFVSAFLCNHVHPNVTIKLNSSSDRGNTECVVCVSVYHCVCLSTCLSISITTTSSPMSPLSWIHPVIEVTLNVLSVCRLSIYVCVCPPVYFHNNHIQPNVNIKLNSSSDRGNIECVVCLSSVYLCVCLSACLSISEFPQQPHPAKCHHQVEFIQW